MPFMLGKRKEGKSYVRKESIRPPPPFIFKKDQKEKHLYEIFIE